MVVLTDDDAKVLIDYIKLIVDTGNRIVTTIELWRDEAKNIVADSFAMKLAFANIIEILERKKVDDDD